MTKAQEQLQKAIDVAAEAADDLDNSYKLARQALRERWNAEECSFRLQDLRDIVRRADSLLDEIARGEG